MALLDRLDRLRDAGYRVLKRADDPLTSAARRVNEVLGRPLAPVDELADRRAFERGYRAGDVPAAPAVAAATPAKPEAAPVIVYYFKEKQWRDVAKVTDILDANGVPYQVFNLDGDEATQAAVRRDANGRGGPLCFVAGECLGGRTELVNLAQTGELKRRVWG